MMERCPEPQALMDDPVQAQAYATADFEIPHTQQINFLRSWLPTLKQNAGVADLGCGSADMTIRLARLYENCRIDAIDGAASMLQCASKAIAAAGLSERIHLVQKTLPLPSQAPALSHHYDLICATSVLHHFDDPHVFWQSMRQLATPGCAIFVADLMRPKNRALAESYVKTYAGTEPEILQRDFYNSLLAAFRPEEVLEQLVQCNIEGLHIETISNRHMVIYGYWSG